MHVVMMMTIERINDDVHQYFFDDGVIMKKDDQCYLIHSTDQLLRQQSKTNI